MGKRKKSKKKGGEKQIPNEEAKAKSQNMHVENSTEECHTKYTVEDLLDRVAEYLQRFEYDLAEKFCQKALDMEPNNTNVLEVFGNVCAESGNVYKAKEFFKNAVEIEPKKGYLKYLYLGQLSEGDEAAKYYLIAIDLIKSDINNEEDSNNDQYQIELSNVYCSLAELYMTDCCMEENAQELCKNYCELAVEACDSHIDAYIATSNYFLSCNEMDSAKVSLDKAYNLWKTKSDAANCESDNVADIISYETRVTLVKILIEIEKYENVSPVIDQLIEENEDDIRIWYYLGLAKYFQFEKDNNLENPRFYLEKALELFEKLSYEDDEMKDHISELLKVCPVQDMETIDEENESESDLESVNDDSMET